MRSNLRKMIDALVGIALVAVLVLVVAKPSSAYPPGSSLTLTSNKTHVTSSENVTFTASYATPFTSVKFTYGKLTKSVTANGSGVAVVTLKTGGTGVWVAKAQNASATATTTVYAPKISLTKSSAKPGTSNSVKVQFTQPGSLLNVVVGSQTYTGVGAGSNTVTINFPTPAKGRYTVLVFVNSQQFSALRLDSK